MKLVIVESPSKAKTIEKYLGKEYKVIASKGHVVDLPKSEIGIDTENDFKPTYVVTKEASLKKLKKTFKDADELILAVDPDREGEAIGWHIAVKLGVITEKGNPKKNAKPLKRIVFTEITEKAVKEAAANPREVNMNLVDAQQARRILDRIVGYKLSPLLWKKIRFGLSAGRVQSVALKLIVDRERERDAFNPEEYWSATAYTHESKKSKSLTQHVVLSDDEEKPEFADDLLPFNLSKRKGKKWEPTKQSEVESMFKDVEGEKWIIDSLEKKKKNRSPQAPFTTSTLQQVASNRFGMSAKQTMSVAQKLYEAGFITYMRTDSTTLSDTAINAARKFISKSFGSEFVPEKPNVYSKKSKNSQEAHEAIRPTDFSKAAKALKLDDQKAKLYTLIRARALSSQMKPAELEATTVIVNIKDYEFRLTGQRVVFPGFMEAYEDNINEVKLPELKEGQEVYAHDLVGTQSFTKPPARYSEASLIKALESFGIGRPSTYAPIISTIMARKYVEKDGRYLFPTDTGTVVIRLLEKHFENIVDVDFTANLEDELDKIAEGKEEWTDMMADFYKPFEKNLQEKEEEITRDDFTVMGDSPYKCPECKKKMVIKLGRYGRFHSCSDFPDCKGMRNIDGKTEEEMEKEAYTKEFQAIYKEPPKTDDGRDYLLKRGRYGKFWAHPDYPKVKDAQALEYTDKIKKAIYGATPKAKDGTKMILRSGRFGEFWAHPDYPDKKEVVRIKKKEVVEKKKELGIE